jgi:hypothetical protein
MLRLSSGLRMQVWYQNMVTRKCEDKHCLGQWEELSATKVHEASSQKVRICTTENISVKSQWIKATTGHGILLTCSPPLPNFNFIN